MLRASLWATPLAILLLAAACLGGGGPEEPTASPQDAARAFLDLWKQGQYDAMYALLSTRSQATFTRDYFVGRYRAIAEEATITGVDYELLPHAASPAPRDEATPQADQQALDTADVPVRVTVHTAMVGDIAQENTIPLIYEEVTVTRPDGKTETRKEWRVQWHPSLIFKELDDRSLVRLVIKTPRRGTIYDRNGQPLAMDARIPVVGIVPRMVKDRAATAAALSRALGISQADVWRALEAKVPDYYFVPVKRLPWSTTPEQLEPLYALEDLGVLVQYQGQRVYPNGDSAAHIIGYLREVTEEELKELEPKGYRPGDMKGAAGIEGLFDTELAGERGATLLTVTPEGQVSRVIAERPGKPGLDVHLTIDINVQKVAESTLGQQKGAVVVLDPRDNSVLALASYPRFDPNSFVLGLSPEEADRLINSPDRPLMNRALEGTYPPGSTFKVVTTAAALERGGYSPASRLPCPPVWTGLGPNYPLRNWQTVDRGPLTPAEGLMSSCNPVFYQMAYTLDQIDPGILPDFARGFGFGSPTGIELPEASGLVPDPRDPDWKMEHFGDPNPWFTGDSVVLGIGQGYLTVTPLQIANAYAALARDGTLMKPFVVRKITDAQGNVVREFQPQVKGKLPISPQTLAAIKEGLRLVTQSPGGTAYAAFAGSGVDAAGKSGTPEAAGPGQYHGYFAAYAPRENPSWLVLVFNEDNRAGSVLSTRLASQILRSLAAPPPPR
ncbi:Peptidoglycan D,D-transpeptidase MrdA [bacterium HR25]|nr:Peptidoglycan D,D-transpeptidase MrdA [bacterium HR25]